MEADDRTNGGSVLAGVSSTSGDSAALSGRKRSYRIRKIAAGCVVGIGMALICIAAIPAGILLGVIDGIVRAMSFFTDKLADDPTKRSE